MKIIKIILLILLIVFVGIQFIPTKRNQSHTVPKTDFILVNKMPEDLKNKLQVSCYDCHSNNTAYPWYNKVQPITWFLKDHIEKGKKELNFSEWDSYSNRRKKSKLKSISSQIRDDKMPLSSYTLIHRNALFSEAEKQRMIEYLTELKNNL